MKFKETRLNQTPYPTVFYIGMGKTGSASLYYGIKSHSVAHWHNTEYYCRIHNDYRLLENDMTVYDLVEEIGQQHNFTPIVIESFRDPVAQRLSWYFQVFKGITAKQAIHAMQSDLWQYESNLEIERSHDLHYAGDPNRLFELIHLRFEDIELWQEQLSLHDIDWQPTHSNKRKNYEYVKAKETLKLSQAKLEQIYFFNSIVTDLYSEQEIFKFIDKWRR